MHLAHLIEWTRRDICSQRDQSLHRDRLLRRSRLALVAVAAIAPALLGAQTIDTQRREFVVSDGSRVEVAINRGSIKLLTAPGNEVVVEAYRKVTAGSDREEKRLLAADELVIAQSGNTVTVKTASPSAGSSGWSWRNLFGWGGKRFDYRYTITVPAQTQADLATAGGGIEVNGLMADLRARTSGGGLSFANINGAIDGRTSGGSIKLSSCDGTADLRTSGGGISADRGGGTLRVETSGGSVSVSRHLGDVTARTSGGSITVDGVDGNVEARTSGGSIRAVFTSVPTQRSMFTTSGGSIRVELPEGAAVNLDAVTSGGGVRCEIPLDSGAEAGRGRIKGAVHGGGPELVLRTSGGSITVSGRS